MPMTQSQTTATIRPDLDGIPEESRDAYLRDIGEFIVSSILDDVGQGVSPVTGQRFKSLNADYADEEKGGDRLPNLDLEGDMLNSLKFVVNDNEIEFGIFNEAQAVKSYGHNTGMQGHPYLEGKVPQRKFIPFENESLRSGILKGFQGIKVRYEARDQAEDREEVDVTTTFVDTEPRVRTLTTFDALFGDLFADQD